MNSLFWVISDEYIKLPFKYVSQETKDHTPSVTYGKDISSSKVTEELSGITKCVLSS
jgi:hypothetical protein